MAGSSGGGGSTAVGVAATLPSVLPAPFASLMPPMLAHREREELADALIMVGERDPQALGRAMRAAGFRAEDLA